MDNKEDALGKISRQLASMSGNSNDSGNDGLMWTPFSGINAQANDVQFSNLYTWNPMDLPDFDPLTSATGDANVPSQLDLPGKPRLSEINPNQMNWFQGLDSERFVSCDKTGSRLTHTEGFSPHNFSLIGQKNIPSSYESVSNSHHNPHIMQQLSHSLSPNQNLNSERTRFVSQNPASNSIFLNSRLTENIPSLGFTYTSVPEKTSSGMDIKMQSSRMSPNSLFDPCIASPLLTLHQQAPENMASLSSVASVSDVASYLNASSIGVDLGVNINDRGSPIPDVSSLRSEEENVLQSFKNNWNSFDSKLVTNPQKIEPLIDFVVSDTMKPSYSDIAKTPKLCRSDQFNAAEHAIKSQTPRPVKKENKTARPQVKRTSSGSNYWPKSAGTDTEHSKSSPSTRYGLDNFHEQVPSPGSQSFSSESLTQVTRNRRGSSSSADGLTFAPDDLAHGSKLSYTDTNLLDQSQEKKSDKTFKDHSSGDHTFFDPRRIFQAKPNNRSKSQTHTKPKETNVNDQGKLQAEMVLNNGKPTASNATSKLSSSAKQHDYINNDLRDTSKLTNQLSAESGHGSFSKKDDVAKVKETLAAKRSGGRTGGVYRRHRSTDNGHIDSEVKKDSTQLQQEPPGLLAEFFDKDKIDEIYNNVRETCSHYGNWLVTNLIHLLLLLFRLIVYITSGGVCLFQLLIASLWHWFKVKFSKDSDSKGSTWNARDYLRRRVGLEENIALPSTGEEAMKRLLACKGKDPYSILGLRADSTDEDIKKYYRKQAVLVHPDKNQEPGAEEAFKVLGHAFEMIGDATKRKTYDSHTQEANEAEAMREFAEMLSKLQTKIQEAANIMPCDNCDGKHQRFPVDRPFYSARFCARCNIFHAAKEGDVWAETTMLGFRWHYYALMENHVYDITDWMACHKEYFKHMKANYHGVTYRIATEGNKRKRQTGEPSLEDFINHLINKSTAAAEGQNSSWGQSQTQGDNNSWGHSSPNAATTAAAAAAKQKGRRKKKRN